jgi:hypothetical protein
MSETNIAPDAANDGWADIEVIYAGRRESTRKDTPEPYMLCYTVTDQNDELVFTNPKTIKLFKNAIIGGVYKAQRKVDSFRLTTNFIRSSGSLKVPGWRAEERGMEVAMKARRLIAAEKTKGNESIQELMTPIREAYGKTDYIGRLAIEVVVLAALRRPML